jgi:hypothetical protein
MSWAVRFRIRHQLLIRAHADLKRTPTVRLQRSISHRRLNCVGIICLRVPINTATKYFGLSVFV